MSLVRTAVALRWALLRGSLRAGPGSTARRTGLALGALGGAAMAVLCLLGLAATRGHGDLPTDLSVIAFTVLTLGWVVLPVATFASDDLMDPGRLALLPLTRRQVLVVMGCGALVGVAPAATAVAALGVLPATATGPASAIVALVSVALLLALCVGASRAVASSLSGLLRSRRGRDLGVVLAAVVALSVQLVNPLVQVGVRRAGGSGAGLTGELHRVTAVLRLTPPGLLATAPGRPLPAAVASLLAVAAVVTVVLVVWERSVRRALERPDASGGRRGRSTVLQPRWLPLPRGRAGAVAAKDLRYLLREPRRSVALVTSALVPVLVVLGPLVAGGVGVPAGVVYAVCGVGLLMPLNVANRFGLDGTATWVLVASGTDQRDARRDLLGGDLAVLVVAVPLLLVMTGALAAAGDGWRHAPAAVGLAVSLLLVGLGLAATVAVVAPFPVPPSQNAFSGGGTGQGVASGLLSLSALAASAVVNLPLLALVVPAARGSSAASVALLVVGPLYGLLVGGALRRAAASLWARRAPEVLQVLAQARS